MAQLHFYVPAPVESELRKRAKASGLSLSRYLAELVQREIVDEWPEGFFEQVVGGWSGPPLERPEQGTPEVRDPL